MRTCALTYQIKGPKTVNEAKIGLFRKIAILHVTVGGLLIWYDSAQVRMWIILNINHNPRCVQEPWDILVVQNRTQGRCVMFLTENELFAQFVFLLGLKYIFCGKNILLGQSTSLGHSATGHPVYTAKQRASHVCIGFTIGNRSLWKNMNYKCKCLIENLF